MKSFLTTFLFFVLGLVVGPSIPRLVIKLKYGKYEVFEPTNANSATTQYNTNHQYLKVIDPKNRQKHEASHKLIVEKWYPEIRRLDEIGDLFYYERHDSNMVIHQGYISLGIYGNVKGEITYDELTEIFRGDTNNKNNP